MVRIQMRLEEGPLLISAWHLPAEQTKGKDFDLYTLRLEQAGVTLDLTSRDKEMFEGFLFGLNTTVEEEGLLDDE